VERLIPERRSTAIEKCLKGKVEGKFTIERKNEGEGEYYTSSAESVDPCLGKTRVLILREDENLSSPGFISRRGGKARNALQGPGEKIETVSPWVQKKT